jgi:hypothetical protein
LKPFAREQKEMPDMRWLTILNDNTAIFGTPITVGIFTLNPLDNYTQLSRCGLNL